jgi:hypothetical protein
MRRPEIKPSPKACPNRPEVDGRGYHQKSQKPHSSRGKKGGAHAEIMSSHEAGRGLRQDYGFFSGGSLTMRGAAWLTTMRSGLFFFGFFFSRLGASLFPMIAACHGFPHLARANEVPASNSPRDS